MENTTLNGTTATTANAANNDHEDWKKKKGYGPIIVALSLVLLLGLSFYMGGHFDDSTNLHRNEKEMQHVAASSSSMSLVGSGTAASDLKTLTIELDDDKNIDVLLSGWSRKEQRKGGSSASCTKNTGYNCGAVFPPYSNTCSQTGCCCHKEYGGGDKMNTCDNAKGYAYRGCNSCWGKDARFGTTNINVGTYSCHGKNSCKSVSDSTIYGLSCQGSSACLKVKDSTVGGNSCQGDQACDSVKNSIIGADSCNGDGSPCASSENVKIGEHSCNSQPVNGNGVCNKCKHNVPDNACNYYNQGITADLTASGYCIYCL